MAKYTTILCFFLLTRPLLGGVYSLDQSLTGHEAQVSTSDSYKVVTGWGSPPAELPQGQPILQNETYAYLVLISEYLTGESATSLSEGAEVVAGWNKVGWFGFFFAKFYPWVYHENLGWIYISEKGADGTWFHFESLGWIWTNKDNFPSLYLHERGEWSYLDLGRSQPTLYDYRYKTWFQANQPYVLSGSLIPANGGSVTGYGEFYRWDTAVLNASASDGYRFSGWGGDFTGEGTRVTFEVLGDATVDATFVPVITPNSEPDQVISESFDLIKNMKNLTPVQKERSMAELLIQGKSETSSISILPKGQ